MQGGAGGYDDPFQVAGAFPGHMVAPPHMDSPNYGAPMDYGQQVTSLIYWSSCFNAS